MPEKFTPVPEEARDFKVDEKKTPEPSDETKYNIQTTPSENNPAPEAVGDPINWQSPDGNVITPEKEELYRSPETLPEKEPGHGPKPAWSDDPTQTTASDDQITAKDIDEGSQIEKSESDGKYQLSGDTKRRIQNLNKDIEQAQEVDSDMIADFKRKVRANDMAGADQSFDAAEEAKYSAIKMRMEQSELQAEADKSENQ